MLCMVSIKVIELLDRVGWIAWSCLIVSFRNQILSGLERINGNWLWLVVGWHIYLCFIWSLSRYLLLLYRVRWIPWSCLMFHLGIEFLVGWREWLGVGLGWLWDVDIKVLEIFIYVLFGFYKAICYYQIELDE